MMRAMAKRTAILGAIVLAGLAVWFLVLSQPTVAGSSAVDPDVTIECDGSTSVSEESCLAWGDEVLTRGAPSTTFEMQDLVRLRFSKPMLGFGSPCQVEYFLQRYPDDGVWREDIPCRGE
jgi:hypothetical protein